MTQFKKELTLVDSTLLVIGSMIGSAIFMVSSEIASSLGSSGYLLLVWILSGILTLAAALSFAELAAMMPTAGGQYIYLCKAYNPLVGFLYGWTFFAVIQAGSVAAIAVAFAKFASILWPIFSDKHILLTLGPLEITPVPLLAIVSIVALTYLNIFGLHEGKLVQNILTVIKAFALIGLIVLGLFMAFNRHAVWENIQTLWQPATAQINGSETTWNPLKGLNLFIALCTATTGALFAMDAWNNITFTAGEVKNPKRIIPLSLSLGVGFVLVLYLLVNVVYLTIFPVRGDVSATSLYGQGIAFAFDGQIGAASALMIFGSLGAAIMALCIMVSAFGCNNGLILSGSRVFYAMAQDRLFFKSAGRLNRYSSPSNALIWQCVWSCVLTLSGSYNKLLDFVIFAVLLFYILTVAGIFILRAKYPEMERPYKAWGYPVLPLFYIVFASIISLCLLFYKPLTALPGMGIVLLGIPIYYIWKWAESKK